MKVTFNSPVSLNSLNRVSRTTNPQRVSQTQTVLPYSVLSFGGNKLDQVAILSAETQKRITAGGVGTVVQDLADGKVFSKDVGGYDPVLFTPYYNGRVIEEIDKDGAKDATGNLPTKFKKVEVLKKDGVPIFTKIDLAANNRTVDSLKPGEFVELLDVGRTKFDLAGKEEEAVLYKIAGIKNEYMIYTDGTARMRKPYESVFGYSSEMQPLGQADPYASFNKAFVKLLPQLEDQGVNPKHLLLNDAQTAYTMEYIAQEAQAGNGKYYADVTSSYVAHNLGSAYQQRSTDQAMFLNLATKEEFEKVKADPNFETAKTDAKKLQAYFKSYVDPVRGGDGACSATMIAVKNAQRDNLSAFTTVSPGYAGSVAIGPGEAPGIKSELAELYSQGKFFGILNGMSNSGMNPNGDIGLPYYSANAAKAAKDQKFEPFKTFFAQEGRLDSDKKVIPLSTQMDTVIKTKQENAANLFARLDKDLLARGEYHHAIGKKDAKNAIYGYIDKQFIEKIKNGEHVDLFASWGRADEQKGLDLTINAFMEHAKNNPNSVLILGGPRNGDLPLSDAISNSIEMAKTKYPGRFVYMDGFSPAPVLSSAADVTVFPSRFAPCELTDLEAKKYGCTPIVTGFQGLDDKNPDIRNPKESATATSFKTKYTFISDYDSLKLDDPDVKSRPMKADALQEYITTKETITRKIKNELSNKEIAENVLDANKNVVGEHITKYTPEKVAELLKNKLAESYELKEARKKVADKFVTDDLVMAMDYRHQMTTTPEGQQQLKDMVYRAMTDKTGWTNNDVYSTIRRGKVVHESASNIYISKHIEGRAKPITERLFNSGAATEVVAEATGDATKDTAKDTAKNTSTSGASGAIKDGLNNIDNGGKPPVNPPPPQPQPLPKKFPIKQAAIIAAIAAVVAGALYYIFKPEEQAKKKTNKSSVYIA